MIHERIDSNIGSTPLYRNQFVLGPRFTPQFESWKKYKINGSVFLTVHPNLDVHQSSYDGKSITLLGFMLDPDHPKSCDAEIVELLVQNFVAREGVLEQTERFGGRWILVIDDGETISIFNDATGLRQVYYTVSSDSDPTWCASQPRIIAELLDLQVDKEASDFIDSPAHREAPWWPGNGSPYKEVKHLLPNHFLDLRTGSCHRYWPDRNLGKKELDSAITEVSEILCGLMLSAANRFELTLLMTAGKDSRTVLAACREIADRLSYISIGIPRISNLDTEVPAVLLSELGLKHHIAVANSDPSNGFWIEYERNATLAHSAYAANAEAILPFLGHAKVAVTGHASEVVECFYRLPRLAGRKITPSRISLLTGMDDHPYAIKSYKNWLSGVGNTYDVNILDLLYWEQRAGSWLAKWLLEYDLVWKDCVIPFNCRRLLTILLSIDERHRSPPEYAFCGKLIGNLWPELLRKPIIGKTSVKRTIRARLSTVKRSVRFLLAR